MCCPLCLDLPRCLRVPPQAPPYAVGCPSSPTTHSSSPLSSSLSICLPLFIFLPIIYQDLTSYFSFFVLSYKTTLQECKLQERRRFASLTGRPPQYLGSDWHITPLSKELSSQLTDGQALQAKGTDKHPKGYKGRSPAQDGAPSCFCACLLFPPGRSAPAIRKNRGGQQKGGLASCGPGMTTASMWVGKHPSRHFDMHRYPSTLITSSTFNVDLIP